MIGRRSLLRYGVLAPLAPVLAPLVAKLSTVSSAVQRVTAQSAVQNLVDNLTRAERLSSATNTIERVEYVGEDLAVVAYRTEYAAHLASVSPGAPVGPMKAAIYSYTLVFNAGSQAVHYVGHVIPPGAWQQITGGFTR